MQFDRKPIFTASVPGPWGVDTHERDWYVINSRTLVGVRIGPIGGKKINYFDKAMALADDRNRKESK